MSQTPSGAADGGTTPGGQTHPSQRELRTALLASLGLPADADAAAVEAAHAKVSGYLTSAPSELSAWAGQQAAAADAAHAVLTGKAGDVLARRATATTTTAAPREIPKPLLVLGTLATIAAIVLGVYYFGPGRSATSQTPAVSMGQSANPSAGASATPTPVDAAKVAALEAKLKSNPKDIDSMAQLGDIYFAAEKYTDAAKWRQKMVDLSPKDTDLLLATGVAYLNAGDFKNAEDRWTKAITIDPKKTEAYYNLGFLQVMKTPPDSAKAKQMWDKVVELEPNGALAMKVQNHLGALATPAPTAPAATSAPTAPATSSAPAQ